MKSERKEVKSTTESRITSALPSSIETSCLLLVDIGTLCEYGTRVSKKGFFQHCHKDSPFWKELYKALFGKPKFEADYKEQCIAEFLLSKATTTRADKAHYYFTQLKQFLVPKYQNKPWAKKYLGMIEYSNPNNFVAAGRGIDYLMEGIVLDDVRAARYLVRLIYTLENDDRESALERIDGRDGARPVLVCLEKAVSEGNSKFKRELSYLHAKGIGTCSDGKEEKEENNKKAFKLFKESITCDVRARKSLDISEIDILKLYEAIDFDLLGNPNLGMDFLLDLFFKTYHPSIACVIASLFHGNGDSDTGKFWLQVAHMYGSGMAACALAYCFAQNEQAVVDEAYIRYLFKIASARGYGLADRKHADYLIKSGEVDKINEAKDLLKKSFLAGETDSVCDLSALIREEKDWADDPSKVWWVQTAALCGYGGSRNALKEAAAFGSANAAHALACLLEIGIPGLNSRAPQHSGVVEYMKGVNVDTLSNYLKAGHTQGLLDRYLLRIFERLYQEAHPGEVLQVRAKM